MDDLISRRAAIDAIGKVADELYKNIIKGATFPQRQWFDGMAYAESVLENLPSAQPDIIRCKDCKHYQFADNRAFGMPIKMCEWFGFEDVDDFDFCSRAERKTNG